MKSIASRALLVLAGAVFCGSALAQVYRCGNAYQAEPCAGGKVVDTAPPLSDRGGDGLQALHLCEAYSGRSTFWTPDNCASHRATLKRVVRVPRNLPWADKVALARQARIEGDALRAPPRAATYSAAAPAGASACSGYAQALEHNTSAARAGGTAQWMEHLAAERRRILAEQSAAGCR